MQSLMLKSSVNQALHAYSGSHALFKHILQWLQRDLWSLGVLTVVIECCFESWNTLFWSQMGYFFFANTQ